MRDGVANAYRWRRLNPEPFETKTRCGDLVVLGCEGTGAQGLSDSAGLAQLVDDQGCSVGETISNSSGSRASPGLKQV